MQTVNHRTFGIGEVIGKEARENDVIITARFAGGKEMRFAILSFESGWVVAEGDLKEEIEKLIADKKALEIKKRADFIAKNTVNATAPVARHRTHARISVTGHIATAFEAYLINAGYSTETPSGYPSTVYSYIDAIERNVLDGEHITWDILKNNIDSIVARYDVGGEKADIGAKSKSTVINALKRFKDFINP